MFPSKIIITPGKIIILGDKIFPDFYGPGPAVRSVIAARGDDGAGAHEELLLLVWRRRWQVTPAMWKMRCRGWYG